MTTKTRILVVDDEERFRHTITSLLAAEGFSVRAAGSGSEGLNILAGHPMDVVLLDLKMPGLSGEETFRHIRQQGFDVETICLTGHAAIDEATELLREGVFDYLVKPASVAEIIEAVRRAKERKLLRHGEISMAHLIGGSTVD